MIIGYARVSTTEQDLDPQIQKLKEAGVEKIYTDIGSGVKTNREGFLQMKNAIRKGDTVLVYRIDRIFRSLRNMVDLIEEFKQLEVNFKSLSEPQFDTSSANGLFLLQIFSAVAEFERNLIRERTKVGLDSARRRNKHLGRPKGIPKEMKSKYEYAKHLYENKNTPILKACKEAGISKASFYRLDKSQ